MAPSFVDGTNLFDYVVRDGNGVKGMVDSGISKVPEEYVQPPKERIDRCNSFPLNRPPIDLSGLGGPCHGEVVEAITTAGRTLGFFQVINHGVPLELLESLKEAAHRFFERSPEEKAVYRNGVSPSPYVKYGTSFNPEKEKVLEWKDYISMVYTNDDDAIQHWPKDCKEVSLEYLKTSRKMVKTLLDVLIGDLGVKSDDESSKLIDSLIGQKVINMNFYPKCPNPELTVGVGRHSDAGTLTVLLQDGIGGLYIKLEEDGGHEMQQSKWVEIPPIPGALVINVGDALQILSNGRYKSTEHRVITTSGQSRVSVPIFNSPDATMKIGPLPELVEKDGVARYREVLFKDYMKNYFGQAHDGKKTLDFAKI